MTPLPRLTGLLLNIAHGLDHMFLLIFATAVAAVASAFGFARWEDMMPYSAGAFVMFGFGSIPAGRLGDLWGRRRMMLVFFFGLGAAALLAACTTNALQMAAALTLLGAFASIYHPVGIPMLVQGVKNPGATIGVNGLAGNLGVAAAALVSGLLVEWLGWRAAFAIPGVVCLLCGAAFARFAPREIGPPASRSHKAQIPLPAADMVRVLAVMTVAAATASLLFNFTTNGNGRLLEERFRGVIEDPALLGALLAAVYAVASVAQVVVGRLIDRVPLKPLYLTIVVVQAPLLALAANAQGWWLFVLLLATMTFLFGSIPFTDAMIVRYVDDRLRSRVAGVRIGLSFTLSSLAVWALGPIVKSAGFGALLFAMAGIAVLTAATVMLLPREGSAAARPALERRASERA